jgi:hypothetical protein
MVALHNDLKKRKAPKSIFLSSRRIGIFTQLVIGPTTFKKKFEPLVWLNVFKTFF